MSDYPKLPPNPEGQPMPAAPPYPQEQPPMGASTVIMGPQSTVYGNVPQRVTCQYCGADGVTAVELESSSVAWLICLGLCLSGIFLVIPFFICWLPFCIDPCRDTVHKCASCGRVLGKKPALGLRI